MDCCPSVGVMLAHLSGEKSFMDFTSEELVLIPYDYLLKTVKPMELLNIWSKLPISYKSDFLLQIKLPCFIHYNRPDWSIQFDGPPTSQEKCRFCKITLKEHYV